MSIEWFVAHTQPNKENLAVDNLERQGFHTYVPRYSKIRRHARREEIVRAPLFPRYIFIGMDIAKARWLSVDSTRGISYLLRQDSGQPAKIPNDLINSLRDQENDAGLLPLASTNIFTKGDKVRIAEGAFADLEAEVESLDDKQRVSVLLNFMQREIKVALPFTAVEAA